MSFLHSFKKKYYYSYLILSILAVYLILQGFLYIYIGITDKRGLIFSDFLARFSLIQYYLEALIYPTCSVLELLGYTSRHSYLTNSVGIFHGSGVLIAHGCLG
ncbi:MAG: hypothetical protein H7259_08365, partial [Cytophagales bacterium]|nr:hypothetical protein [Cytophaga sp.]